MRQFIHQHPNLGYVDLRSETGENGRRYTTPSGAYPSITTVLGKLSEKAIKEWRERVGEEEANRVSRTAAYRGTKVHEALETYLDNIEPTIGNPIILDGFRKIKAVVDERVGVIYGQEKALYSDHFGVAGRVDLVAEFDGRRSIVDFKTSNKAKERDWVHGYFMQEAFYAVAWEERTGQAVDQLVTIIACDSENEAQVFIEKRDDWIEPLKRAIESYNEGV